MSTKPFLKWAGGKTQLLPQLLKLIPYNFNNYFEPFIGGGAVFFSLEKELIGRKSYINDINASLIGTYQNVQKNTEKLINNINFLEKEYKKRDTEKQKEFYYDIRKKYNDKNLEANNLQKSAYFLFLNKTGYNGMYRENRKGEFNIPFGKYSNPKICDSEVIKADAKQLQSTIIRNTSFEKAIEEAKAGDLIYFDPPYYPLSKTANFTNYHETGFLENKQHLLKETFKALDKKGCFLMLSNSETAFIKQLYKDYKQIIVQANRMINSKATGRGKTNEIIITNF
jgi:DNA adenine methylase